MPFNIICYITHKLMSACRHVGIRILRDDADVLIQIECVRGRNSRTCYVDQGTLWSVIYY